MSIQTVDFQTLRTTIQTAYLRLNNWRAVGAEFGLTSGLAYRIAVDGYEPKEATIRYKLGLPAMVPTAVCPDCGQVHKIEGVCIAKSKVTVTVVQMTADELAKVERPVTVIIRKPHTRRDSRPRATINTADPHSAAKTIRKKMDPDTLAALLELLK